MWSNVLLVALGGGLGATLRYGLGLAAEKLVPTAWIPLGTLTANVLGCLAIGYVLGRWEDGLTDRSRLFVVTGLLGGLTTFSSFAGESFNLGVTSGAGRLLANVSLHLTLGLAGVWVGFFVARRS
ncbi:MAG: CrcB family protein [Bacteroidota bacterium]